MKSKIVIVGLCSDFNKQVANLVSQKIGFFFLDIEDYISYSLQQPELMKQKCGIEYYKKQELSTIRSCVDYEKTVINIPFEYYYSNDAYKLFIDNSEIVYIYFNKSQLKKLNVNHDLFDNSVINLLAYEDYDKVLKRTANVIIDVGKKNIEQIVDDIASKLEGI